jgi:renalase
MSANDKPIAILGAGIAGLSCAARLLAGGHAVEILERSRAPGGRASTRRGEDWQCDHGAQYFTARDADFRAAVEQWSAAGIVAPWQARFVSFDGSGLQPVTGDEPRFVGTPRMSALARHLGDGLPIRYDTRVTALGRDGEDWIFDTEREGVLDQSYSGVILAVPSQQAQALLVEAAPAFATVAHDTPMRGTWALIARFTEDRDLGFDAAFVNAGPLSWVARDSSKPGRPVGNTWILHAPAADDIGDESDQELSEIAEAMIEEFMRLGAPRPAAHTLHRWRFAGTHNTCSIGSLWDPVERLGMAGDWMSGGRVEGAWLSGRQAADAVIASTHAREEA